MYIEIIAREFSKMSGDNVEIVLEQMFVEDNLIIYIGDFEYKFNCETLQFI